MKTRFFHILPIVVPTELCTPRRNLEKSSIEEINKEISSFSGVNNLWINSGTEEASKVIGACFIADKMIWEHKDLHKDLFRWLILNSKDEENGDGMNLNVLGLHPSMKPSFPLFKKFGLVTFLNEFGLKLNDRNDPVVMDEI